MKGIEKYSPVLSILQSLLLCTQAMYHIRPTSDSPCLHKYCLTLSEYASQNMSYSNSDNLTLVFLPGEHVLNTSILFQLLDSVSLLGNFSSLPNITSKIVCRERSAFVLQNIHYVEIIALAFGFCGRSDNSTVNITNLQFIKATGITKVQNVVPAISALLVMNFHLINCQFQENFLPVLLNKTEVHASGNQFTGNTGGLGGAVAVYNSTVFFLGQNHFINNQAEIGGGIFTHSSKLVITGYVVFHANDATIGGGVGSMYSTLTFREAANRNNAVQNQTDLQGTSSVTVRNTTSGWNVLQSVGNNNAKRTSRFDNDSTFFSDVLFTKNKGGGGAIFTIESTLNSMNTNMAFVDNSGVDGGAIYSVNSRLHFGTDPCTESWTSCSAFTRPALITFTKNFAEIGGAFEAYTSVVVFSNNVTFEHNFAVRGGGGMWVYANTWVYFTGHTTFLNNTVEPKAIHGGGGVYSRDSDLMFNLGSHTAFFDNEAENGAGIHATRYSHLQFSGKVVFFGNKATGSGGGIYLNSNSLLILSGTGIFKKNSAANSGGVISITHESATRLENANVTMAMNSAGSNGGAMSVKGGTHFINGTIVYVGNWAEHNGGAVYADSCELHFINGLYKFEDNAAKNNGYGGGLHAESTDVHLGGSYNFTNNLAGYGGGVAITKYLDHHLSLEPYTTVSFHDNFAQKYGGAMFVEDDQDHYCDPDLVVIGRNCFMTFATSPRLYDTWTEYIHVNKSELSACIGHFLFEGNQAEEGGITIYGGVLHNCRVDVDSRISCSHKSECILYQTCYLSGLEAIATLTQMSVEQLTQNPLNIMSDTYRVCICDSQRPNCKTRAIDYTSYPGETISLLIAAIENNRMVSVVIHAEIDSETDQVRLGPLQDTQSITNICTYLGYSLFSRGQRNANLLLSSEGQCKSPGIPLVVHVEFLPCPVGFSLSQFGSCICETRLQKYTNTCDINTRTFTRNGDFWLGFDTHGPILHPHCPFDYCKSETVSFTLNSTDLQCADGRSGTLCGACKSGLSLNLGSSRCSSCSNVYLLLFLPFGVAGFLLVIFLFTCKVTVAAGTTSGLIFYANVLAVNRSVFFPSSEANVLTVFIAWLNLDLGIKTCLSDGLDMYTWMWLQFVFPIYIWTLVGLITIVGYYSTTFARIIGPTNPISVLATLFLLSYTKLLRTIIATFSFTTLDYPNDRRVTVWIYDGNIGNFEGKHIPLFLAGLLAFLFLFLPYTLLLLFGQCIEAGSNHRLLSWANNPKVRSFLDAYHAPYKNEHRYWTGLLLLLRFVLFIISAVIDINSPRDPSVNLLVLSITCTILMIWVWNTGNMYRKRYNNALESSFILNLAILTLASYQVKVEGGNQAAVVYTSVSVACVTFLGIIMYHVVQQIVDSRIWRNSSIRSKLNQLKNNRQHHQDPIEMTVTPTAPPPRPVITTFVELRESLLESQH